MNDTLPTLRTIDSSVPPDPVLQQMADELPRELQDHLLGLGFHAFEVLLKDLLEKMGYRDVELLGRTTWRGRRKNPGAELRASCRTGVCEAPVLIQVKQYRRPVARFFVDQLRGTMLQSGAREGLLISTAAFSPAARKAAQAEHFAGIAPVRLIDGEELLDLLFTHKVGVWKDANPKQGSPGLGLDHGYFADLERTYPREERQAASSCNCSVPVLSIPVNPHNQINGGDMTWRTHLLAGFTSLWLLTLVPGAVDPINFAPLMVSAGIGALLPDLDAQQSKIASLEVGGVRPLLPVSGAVHAALGHRGFMHSLAGLALVSGMASGLSPWTGWQIPAAFSLGYFTHLALDACTVSGVPLLFPSKRRYWFLPRWLRFLTGSEAEEALIPLFASATFVLALQQLAAMRSAL